MSRQETTEMSKTAGLIQHRGSFYPVTEQVVPELLGRLDLTERERDLDQPAAQRPQHHTWVLAAGDPVVERGWSAVPDRADRRVSGLHLVHLPQDLRSTSRGEPLRAVVRSQ